MRHLPTATPAPAAHSESERLFEPMRRTMESPRPRRRLKAKTAVATTPQAAVVGRPLSPEPETPQARQKLGPREVFLVTFPHPQQERSMDGYPLTAPGSMSKKDVLDRLLNA